MVPLAICIVGYDQHPPLEPPGVGARRASSGGRVICVSREDPSRIERSSAPVGNPMTASTLRVLQVCKIRRNKRSNTSLFEYVVQFEATRLVVGSPNGHLFNRKPGNGGRQWDAACAGTGARRPVPYGRGKLASSGIGARRSGHLGCGLHELQCHVARIEPTGSANPARRQAVVSDDSGKAAGASGAGRAYSYSTSSRSRFPPPACVA
jgi:hypothetical protein